MRAPGPRSCISSVRSGRRSAREMGTGPLSEPDSNHLRPDRIAPGASLYGFAGVGRRAGLRSPHDERDSACLGQSASLCPAVRGHRNAPGSPLRDHKRLGLGPGLLPASWMGLRYAMPPRRRDRSAPSGLRGGLAHRPIGRIRAGEQARSSALLALRCLSLGQGDR